MFNPRGASFLMPCALLSMTQEQPEGWKDGDEARLTQRMIRFLIVRADLLKTLVQTKLAKIHVFQF